MPITVGDIIRVTCNFNLGDGTQYQNIYHYIFDGIGAPLDSTVVNNVKLKMDLAYNEIEAQVRNDILADLSSVDQVEFVVDQWEVIANLGTFTLSLSGTGAGDGLPNMDSPFVTLKTARPKSVGRKFLFPFVETAQAQTILVAGAITAIVAYSAVILDDITVDLINALIPGIVRTGVNDFLVYTAAVVTNVIGTQKRRRPGVGA